MYDAVVVGGGIVGSSVAYHLARDGADALLVDREDEGRATDAGAGILSPATSSRTGSDPWFEFAVEAVDYYPELVSRLRDEQDGDAGYAQCGLLSVAIREAEVEEFDRAMDRIETRQRELGQPEPGSFAEVSPRDARDRFPALAEVERAAYYEDAARVDGRLLTDALRRAGRAHGLDVREATAEELRVEDGEIATVVTDEETVETEAAVVAGGAWSGEFGDQLGVEIPVEPQRGQIAHLDLGAGSVGGTAGFDPRTTAGGVREVLDEALRVAPGLADAELAEVRVGLRPLSEDGLPVLGPVPDVEGAYLATGHGPTGLQLGPYSGKMMAQMVQGAEPATDVSEFAIGRFS
ncbi:FAD-dependent oxidoreductase [Halobacteriales archaeon SW_6_65_15]|nr:MAG: FAD-dependent oxidoreductase [Halobacteriales archaeon SW_6_65_15]